MPTAEAEHAGADIRDVGELEQALNRPVLAVRAVQDGKHDVEAEARHGELIVASVDA